MFKDMANRRRLLLGVLAGALATPVVAESTDPGTLVEEVVVTGSRISRSTTDASIPVVGLTADSFTNQGFDNFADLAQTLPVFAPAFGESRTQSTFSGVATSGLNRANLRNAGSVRTVTLVNGRRFPGGSATSPAVDFNTMPTANIDRVEIMTGGASAIYGADAMAGVINIITRKDFEGLELDVSYGETFDEGDNENPSYSLMWGNNFGDGGHSLITFQYTEQGQVSCADRYICADDFVWTRAANPIYGPSARSGVGLGGRFFAGNASYTTRDGSITDANGQLIPFVTSIDGYNRNAQRDLAIDTNRTMAAAEVTYPISDSIRAFGEVNYGEAEINSGFEGHPFQSSQPASLFGGGPGVEGLQPSIPLDNPFLPSILRDAVLAADPDAIDVTWWQRFGLFDNRGADSRRDTIRLAAGFQGELESLGGVGSDWNWEVSYVWGQTKEDLKTEGLVATDHLYYGLRVEPDPDNEGGYRCIDPGARATGCIPINPFGYTDEMKDYLRTGAATRGESELKNAVAWMSGTLAELPAGSLNVAFGAEYRTFSGFRDYDNVINNALATGNQIGDIDYVEIETTEGYIETVVPVLAGQPFAESLEVEGAIRFSDTDGLGTYQTWKYGFNWLPIDDVRLRAMKARAVRTPIPSELSGIGQTFGTIADPCTADRRNLNPTRAANCAADGVPVDYDPGQIIEQSVAGLSGGNPDLEEEESDTLTYGIVWTPSFVDNLSVSVDRFEIEIDGAITTVARQAATDFCYDTPDRQFCDVLVRGSHPLLPNADYVLKSVNEQYLNIAEYTIKGVDIQADYAFGTDGFGDFNANLLWTIYDEAEQVQPGGTVLKLKGIAGGSTSDQGYIEHQAVLNLGWTMNAFSANWNMRYVGSAEMGFGTEGRSFPQLDSVIYHNVSGAWAFGDRSRVYAGVNNLFDTPPPFMATSSSGTQALDTVPGYYDVFGVSYFLGITIGL